MKRWLIRQSHKLLQMVCWKTPLSQLEPVQPQKISNNPINNNPISNEPIQISPIPISHKERRMVERFNKPTVKGVITSPQQTYLLNPGNNNILINRLTTVAHITPTMATNLPP